MWKASINSHLKTENNSGIIVPWKHHRPRKSKMITLCQFGWIQFWEKYHGSFSQTEFFHNVMCNIDPLHWSLKIGSSMIRLYFKFHTSEYVLMSLPTMFFHVSTPHAKFVISHTFMIHHLKLDCWVSKNRAYSDSDFDSDSVANSADLKLTKHQLNCTVLISR